MRIPILSTLTLLAAGLLGLAAWAEEKPAGPKLIDVAICLDTSNSMDGLIASAKAKLWDIVNDLAKARPTPELRVAILSYGNNRYTQESGWVRKDLDFTSDLDKVNEKLFSLTTNGGNEYVGRVTRDAMETLQWCPDPKALKIIFVCGNEAATQDPEIKLEPLAETAVRRGIIINTIFCGPEGHSDSQGWKRFSDLAEGRFACINQERGAVAIASPYDKELAQLSSEINTTFCFWGAQAKELAANQAAQDANAAKAGAAVAAARAESKGGRLYNFREHDLVEKCINDPKFDIKTIKDDELPDELKKMTPEEREKHIKGLVVKRAEIQKKIAELSRKREAFVAEEMKKQNKSADQAFDQAIRTVLREQAQKKGIDIPR